MKKITLSFVSLMLLTIIGCSEDDEGINPATDVTNGAVIERVATNSNTIFSGNLDGSLDALLEYRDAEDGTLLDELQVFVTFFDNSEGIGDSSNATVNSEVLLTTVDANAFMNGDNDFPTYNLVITSQDFLTATNNTINGIATNDRFITRLALILTDGRVFSSSNIANNGNLNTDFTIITNVE